MEVGGQQHALLLLDRLAQGPAGALGAAAPLAPLPMPMPLPLPLGSGDSSSAGATASGSASGAAASGPATPATEHVTAQLAALQVGSTLPVAQLVTTEAAAAAAVAALLAAPMVAMDCEGALERGGSISLIQLYAPGAGASATAGGSSSSPDATGNSSGCYVFDLQAMAPATRAAAVRDLARLLESPDTIKVGGKGEVPTPPV